MHFVITSVPRVLSRRMPQPQPAWHCSPPAAGSLPRYSVLVASQGWLFQTNVFLPDHCVMPVIVVATDIDAHAHTHTHTHNTLFVTNSISKLKQHDSKLKQKCRTS